MSNLQLFNGTEVTNLTTGMTSAIKSIQRGTSSAEEHSTITIHEVDMFKSVVICTGDGNAAWNNPLMATNLGDRLSVYAELVGPTTLYIYNGVGVGDVVPDENGDMQIEHIIPPAYITWQVIEFY